MKENLKFFGLLGVVLILLGFASDTQAVLSEVGPGNPANGFPVYYGDVNGLRLELCSDPLDPLCAADNVIVGNQVSEAVGFGAEAFWWLATADLITQRPTGADGRGILVMATEAAWINGNPASNDQMSFGRYRILIDVPEAGTYTVTTPFGTEVFEVTPQRMLDTNGIRAINANLIDGVTLIHSSGSLGKLGDIGCAAAPCDFTLALGTGIGPFLTWDPAVLPAAPVDYIGDPAIDHQVTGSPTGNNFFRIEGPNIGGPGVNVVETNLFSVSGKIFGGVVPTQLIVNKATYSRTASGGQVDVFATSLATSALDASGGLNLPAAPTPMVGNAVGTFYVSIPLADASVLPPSITVTADRGLPSQSQVIDNLVDVVSITKAEFNSATSTLTIEASSSDQVAPPTFTVLGLGVMTAGSLVVPGVTVPPVTVVVTSSSGGADIEGVSVVSAALPSNNPVAANDIAATNNVVAVSVNILSNDAAVAPATLDPATVTIVAQPTNGAVAVNPATGAITYTPNLNFVGTDSFTYTVRDSLGVISNVATVNIVVIALPNRSPIAQNDIISTPKGTAVAVNVLANDVDSDGTLDAASVIVVAQPASGAVAVNPATGAITYTPNLNFVGSDSFTYTVKDNLGTVSNVATVSVTTTGTSETLTVTTAEFTRASNTWVIRGTSTARTRNRVTVRIGPTLAGSIIGTANVDARGDWLLISRGARLLDTTNRISLQSSQGTLLLGVPIVVK